MHQIGSMAAGLASFWKEYFARKGVVRQEDSYPDEVIEVQGLPQTESVISLRTGLDTTNAKLHQPNETIENWKNEMERTLTRMQREMERRFEQLENQLNEGFSASL